jgi:hypothetical protein
MKFSKSKNFTTMSRSPLKNIDEMFEAINDACDPNFYTVEQIGKSSNIDTDESIIRFVITSKDSSVCSYSRCHYMKIGNSYGDDQAYISFYNLDFKKIYNINEMITYIDDYLREYSINYRTFKK